MVGIVVPSVEENNRLYDRGLDAMDSTFGEYAGAWWDEPTITGDLYRYQRRQAERAKLEPTFPDMMTGEPQPSPFYAPVARMSDTDADEQFGIPGHLTFIGKGPQPREVAQQLWELKREELARTSIYERYRGGAAGQVAGFGLGLLSQALDPVNVASAFVPVVGEARMALWAERFGPTVARIVRGGAEGFAGATLMEPLTYALAQDEQRAYGLTDSALNVTFGTIIGSGLHAGGGAVADAFAARRAASTLPVDGAPGAVAGIQPAEPPMPNAGDAGGRVRLPADAPAAVRLASQAPADVNEAALRGSVAALIDDRPVRAASLYEATAHPPSRVGDPDVARIGDTVREGGRNWEVLQAFGRSGPVLVRDADAALGGADVLRAFGSPQEFAKRTGVRLSREDLNAAARELSAEPESLSQYIRRTGGISLDDARNYGLLGPGESPMGKLAGLVRKDGRSLDAVREDVSQEAIGYLKDGADLNELAETISRDLRAGSAAERVYSLNDFENVQNRIAFEQRFDEASRLAELTGDEIDGIRDDAMAAARMMREGRDPVGEVYSDLAAPPGDPFDLETSALLAEETRRPSVSSDRLRDAKSALADAEADLSMMRRSGDFSDEDIRAGMAEADAFAKRGEKLMEAFQAGGNCLARAVV